ncbi:MAG: heme-copper oxidase subunit III [SAR202 cluster bacterium]|nr:heme-copper oxidase subunit III [SAR202 cluster bacterium]
MVAKSTAHAPGHKAHDSLGINRIGLWLFIVSECFLFGALLTSRFYLQGVSRHEDLNQVLGLIISIVLLVSSLSAYRGEMAARYGDQRGFRLNILATLVLGLVFLAGVGYEWHEAYAHFPPSTAFGTAFFTMTGVHATHVLSGLVMLAIVWVRGRDGRYTKGNFWGVEGTVKYWHFVDVAWVFIYPTLYLVS